MAKLTKAQAKAHQQACALLAQDTLTLEEKYFVYENWNEGATHINSTAGAFFTPLGLAGDFAIDGQGGTVIDLCAGIGVLSFEIYNRSQWNEKRSRITCVEINPDYIAVGKKLLPEATWIQADVFDVLSLNLGHFDSAISNPPFGAVSRSGNGPKYTGPKFELHVIDIASQLADYGTFIVPQQSAGFYYSGRQCYERQKEGHAVDFQRLTGLHFETGCGVDTNYHIKDWKGVAPLCEIVCIDFTAPVAANDNINMDLFGAVA